VSDETSDETSGEERYHCDRCDDEMAAKFRRSHEHLCASFTAIAQMQVEQVIENLRQ
jgi:hypothetical protein